MSMNRFTPRRNQRKPQASSQDQGPQAEKSERPLEQGAPRPPRPANQQQNRQNHPQQQRQQRPPRPRNDHPNQGGPDQRQQRPEHDNRQRPQRQQQDGRPSQPQQRPGGPQHNRPNNNRHRNHNNSGGRQQHNRPRTAKTPYDELFERANNARSEYFEKYGRVSDREREALKRGYEQHLANLRKYEDTMPKTEREQYFKTLGPQRLDLNYALAHKLDPQLTDMVIPATLEAANILTPEHKKEFSTFMSKALEEEKVVPPPAPHAPWDPELDPHYLKQQKNSDFSEDTEESIGTYEDYLQAKQFSIKAPRVKSMS
jgi:hypothetical protein